VLLLHGYTATPVETSLLGKYLNERGYSVSAPCLPGHGTTIEDLHRCNWTDWSSHAEKVYLELQEQCKQVFVVGESLGSLLTLYLGSRYPRIGGLILFSPALRARNGLIDLAPFLAPFLKQLKKTRSHSTAMTIVDQRWQGYQVDSLPALAQVLALQKYIRQRLKTIKHPLLIFLGELDQSIDLHTAANLPNQVSSSNIEVVRLKNSSHCIMLDVEWLVTAERTQTFIEQFKTQ
jgi:carboxylesterase